MKIRVLKDTCLLYLFPLRFFGCKTHDSTYLLAQNYLLRLFKILARPPPLLLYPNQHNLISLEGLHERIIYGLSYLLGV
jgi:hypothetical protein